MKVFVDNIIITEDRWDREVNNDDDLKGSLEEFGIIEPIVITEKMELVCGFRRLTFIKELMKEGKWNSGLKNNEVDIFFKEDLSTYQRKAIELEENIRRKNLTWSERDLQTSELHKLKIGEKGEKTAGRTAMDKGGWSQEDTGLLINQSPATVSKSLTIADALRKNPSLANEPSRKAALAKIKREKMQLVRRQLAEYASKNTHDMFMCGDCRELIKGIPDESIGLLLTDIPYDIEVEKTYSNSDRMKDENTSFVDGDGVEILQEIKNDIFRVMVPGSHLYFFCGFDQAQSIREIFQGDFRVRHLPIIWNKVHRGYTPTPDFMIPRNYEICVFMTKGTRGFNLDSPLARDWSDVWTYPKVSSGKKVGINEKPTSLLKDIVSLSSDKGEIVLDIFCGTGPTIEAAFLKDRIGIGFDINEEALVIAKCRVEEAINVKFEQENKNGNKDS